MDDTSIPDPNLAKTQKALQEIRDLPAALLKIAFDLLIPMQEGTFSYFSPSRMPFLQLLKVSQIGMELFLGAQIHARP